MVGISNIPTAKKLILSNPSFSDPLRIAKMSPKEFKLSFAAGSPYENAIMDKYRVIREKLSIPATIWFLVTELEKIPIAEKLAPNVIRKMKPPIQCSTLLNPNVSACSGNIIERRIGNI